MFKEYIGRKKTMNYITMEILKLMYNSYNYKGLNLLLQCFTTNTLSIKLYKIVNLLLLLQLN